MTPSKLKLLVKLFSLLEEKKCYKLEQMMITGFNQYINLRTTPMTKITNMTLDVAEPLPSCDNEVLLIWCVDVTDIDMKKILRKFTEFLNLKLIC